MCYFDSESHGRCMHVGVHVCVPSGCTQGVRLCPGPTKQAYKKGQVWGSMESMARTLSTCVFRSYA